MRRRGRIIKSYSLSYLLTRQPKTLRKHPDYPVLLSYFQTSKRLQQLRLSRRCFKLLDKAVIKPEHLGNFYRTYRLPRDPFFPLFFRIKKEYLDHRARIKRDRSKYIAAVMRSFSPEVLDFIKFLARYEGRINLHNAFPVWTRQLFPTTKKRVNEMRSYTPMEWINFFREYLVQLEARYQQVTKRSCDIFLAFYILHLVPENGETAIPQSDYVKKEYRRLSKIHHPDSGGDAALFVELKWAKEILVR